MPGYLCHLFSFCNETKLPVLAHVNSSLLSKVNAERTLYTWKIYSVNFHSSTSEFSRYQLWPMLPPLQSKIWSSLSVPEWIRQYRGCVSSIWSTAYQTLPSHWCTVLSEIQLRFNVLLQEFNVIYRVMTLGKWTFTSDQLVRGLEQIITIPEWEIKSDEK